MHFDNCGIDLTVYKQGGGKMAITNIASEREKIEATPRVAFDLTPAMVQEVTRILDATDLGSRPEVFRRAFTLLRIHVDAGLRGRVRRRNRAPRPGEKTIW